LKNIFSIYSSGEQVDINSATPLVMNVVLGIPTEVSQLVVKAREEKGFENPQDLLLRVPELSPFMAEIGKLILFRSTVPYYTVESRGKLKERGSVRGLKAIVKIDPREKVGYKVIQWVDRLVNG
jgi:hypothetical protein